MNLIFIAYGTRGDVQPALALAKALKARGHQVRMLAGANFANWIEAHGIRAIASSIDILSMMQNGQSMEWVEHGTNPIRQLLIMKKLVDANGWPMVTEAWDTCQGADAIISSFTSDVFVASIAEKLNVPHISALLQPPMLSTRSGAALMSAPLPRRTNIINWWFGKIALEGAPWFWGGNHTNALRQKLLGLPPLNYASYLRSHAKRLILGGYSSHVAPHPTDWPRNTHTTGYWFLDEQTHWQPSEALTKFLEAGSPPIYIGFGSMTTRDPQAMTKLMVDAVNQSGRRAILLTGWARLGDTTLPPHIFALEAAPHEWLFPRMAAVVHHGGAGTTGASLRAGVPTIIVPHLGDQLFWGERVAALGVGPRAIPRPKLTATRLAAALRIAAGDQAMKQRAVALGAKIRAEDGIGRAVGLMERYCGTSML